MQVRYSSTQKNTKKRTALWVILTVVLLAILGLGVLELTHKVNFFGPEKVERPSVPDGTVNLEPPTEQEKELVEEQKETIVKEQDQPSNPAPAVPSPQTGTKKAVKPVITRSGGGEVSGFVPGIVENGGTCTATFTSGATKVVKTSIAFANVSNTTCAPISYAGSGVQAGWNVVLSYSSITSEGASDASQVQ